MGPIYVQMLAHLRNSFRFSWLPNSRRLWAFKLSLGDILTDLGGLATRLFGFFRLGSRIQQFQLASDLTAPALRVIFCG